MTWYICHKFIYIQVSLQRGYDVILKDNSAPALASGQQTIYKGFNGRVKKRRMTRYDIIIIYYRSLIQSLHYYHLMNDIHLINSFDKDVTMSHLTGVLDYSVTTMCYSFPILVFVY